MKHVFAAGMVAAIVTLGGSRAGAAEVHCDNKPMLGRYLEAFDLIFNQRRFDLIPDYFGDDYHSNDAPPGSPHGPAMLRRFEDDMAQGYPERRLTNDLIVCSDDVLVARQTITAVNDGPLFGRPATHKRQSVTWIDIYRFKDGKFVEQWGGGDMLGGMLQLGYQLTPPKAP